MVLEMTQACYLQKETDFLKEFLCPTELLAIGS